MNIALDVDEVLRNTIDKIVEVYNRDYSIMDKVSYEDITEWNLQKSMMYIGDIGKFFIDNAQEVFGDAKPYPMAYHFVDKLQRAGNKIYILTHQLKGLEGITVDWLHRHHIPYDAIIFSKDKNIVDADMLLDDAVHNLEAFDGMSVCMDRPWNQSWDGARVLSLNEFYRAVKYNQKR